MAPIRPQIHFLSTPLIDQIIIEARDLLATVGLEMTHPEVIELVLEAGGTCNPDGRVLMPGRLVDRALASAPPSFRLHDREGNLRADLGGARVHFTPGSAAINILDPNTGAMRKPTTADFIRYARLVDQLEAIDYPSTAFIPADVHADISDSYRLYLSLCYCSGPVVTGAFTIAGFDVIRDLLLAVRGSSEALAKAPLAILSCCPTAPLKWSDVTSKNTVDCARAGIPVEFISMPLTGFVTPGTLVGTLVQHTAETLSGVVISQLASAGAPVLWGGSPAVFDYRYETTPMGAIETQMVDCACAEIGKHLGLPTQAYIGLSDAKRLDAQAGLETATGAVLAALAGINSISGPGMLDFESCHSLEKLVLDDEICASAKRMLRGIELREGDFPARPHFEELLRDGHLLIAEHTQRWFTEDVRLPDRVIDRANRARHLEEGGKTLEQRAHLRVQALLERPAKGIDADRRRTLDQVMLRAARAAGMDGLPGHDL